jgi:hypothetical protein
MVTQAKTLLDRSAKYIAKGLEMGAYTATVGGDLFAERLLDQIRRYRKDARPRLADAKQLLDRAAKYVGKGLEMGAYTATVGGDLFAERLLEQLRQFRSEGSSSVHHATKKTSPAQLDRDIAEALSRTPGMTQDQIDRYRSGRKWGWPADLSFKAATGRPLSRTPGRRAR